MGVVIRPVDAASARAAGLNTVAGVIIEKVNEASAADIAGLKEGDVVTNIDGQRIVTSPDFMGKIGQHRPGDVLRFEYIRDGKQRETKVKLSDSRNGPVPQLSSATDSPEDILKYWEWMSAT